MSEVLTPFGNTSRRRDQSLTPFGGGGGGGGLSPDQGALLPDTLRSLRRFAPEDNQDSIQMRGFLEGLVSQVPVRDREQADQSFLDKTLDLLSRGQYMTANVALGLRRGDFRIWKHYLDGFTGKRKGDFTQFFEELGLENVPGQLDMADALGFLGNVFLDPTTYVGVGAFTKGGRLAKTVTELRKAKKLTGHSFRLDDVSGPMADEIRAALREGRGRNLFLGKDLAQQALRGQRRLFSVEHPFFKPTAKRLAGSSAVGAATGAGAAIAQGGDLEDIIEGSLAGAAIGAAGSSLRFNTVRAGQVGTIGGAFAGGIAGGAGAAVQGQDITGIGAGIGGGALAGAGLGRLGRANRFLRELPVLAIPQVQNVSGVRLPNVGIGDRTFFPGEQVSNLVDSAIFRGLGRAGQFVREDLPLVAPVIQTMGKLLVPHFRQAGVHPQTWEQWTEELRITQSKLSGAKGDVLDKVKSFALRDDVPELVARVFRMAESEEDQRLIIKAIEQPELLQRGERSVWEDMIVRSLGTVDPAALALAESRNPATYARSLKRLDDGIDQIEEAIELYRTGARPMNEADLRLLQQDLEEAKAYRALLEGGPPPPRPPEEPPPAGGPGPAPEAPVGGGTPQAPSTGVLPSGIDRAITAGQRRGKRFAAKTVAEFLTADEVNESMEWLQALGHRPVLDNPRDELTRIARNASPTNRALEIPQPPQADPGAPPTAFGTVDETQAARAQLVAQIESLEQVTRPAIEAQIMAPGPKTPAMIQDLLQALGDFDNQAEDLYSQLRAMDAQLNSSQQEFVTAQAGAEARAAEQEQLTQEISALEGKPDSKRVAIDVLPEAQEEMSRLDEIRRISAEIGDNEQFQAAVEQIESLQGETVAQRAKRLHQENPEEQLAELKGFRKTIAEQAREAEASAISEQRLAQEIMEQNEAARAGLPEDADDLTRQAMAGDFNAAEQVAARQAPDVIAKLPGDGVSAQAASATSRSQFMEQMVTESVTPADARAGYQELRRAMGLDPEGDLRSALAGIGTDEETVLGTVADALDQHVKQFKAMDPTLSYQPEELHVVGKWANGRSRGPIQVAFFYDGELPRDDIDTILKHAQIELDPWEEGVEVIPVKAQDSHDRQRMLDLMTRDRVDVDEVAYPTLEDAQPQALEATEVPADLPEVGEAAVRRSDLVPAFNNAEYSRQLTESLQREELLRELEYSERTRFAAKDGRELTEDEVGTIRDTMERLRLEQEDDVLWIENELGREAARLFRKQLADVGPRYGVDQVQHVSAPPDELTDTTQAVRMLRDADSRLEQLRQSLDPKNPHDVRQAAKTQHKALVESLKTIDARFGETMGDYTRTDYERIRHELNKLQPEMGRIDRGSPAHQSEQVGNKPRKRRAKPKRAGQVPERKDTGDPIVRTDNYPPRAQALEKLSAENPQAFFDLEDDDLIGYQSWNHLGQPITEGQIEPHSARNGLRALFERGELTPGRFSDMQIEQGDKGLRLNAKVKVRSLKYHPEYRVVEFTDTNNNVYQFETRFEPGLESTKAKGPFFLQKRTQVAGSKRGPFEVDLDNPVDDYQTAVTRFMKQNADEPVMRIAQEFRRFKIAMRQARLNNQSPGDAIESWNTFAREITQEFAGLQDTPFAFGPKGQGTKYLRQTDDIAKLERTVAKMLNEWLETVPMKKTGKAALKNVKVKALDLLGRPFRVPNSAKTSVIPYDVGQLVTVEGRTGIVTKSGKKTSKTREVVFSDGSRVRVGVKELEVGDLIQSAEEGESLIQHMKRMLQDESGAIPMGQMRAKVSEWFKAFPKLRRAAMAEVTDNIVRLEPRLHDKRQDIIDFLDTMAAEEVSRGLLPSFIDFYFPHQKEDSSWRFLFGGGRIDQKKESFQYFRSLEDAINQLNEWAVAAGKSPHFSEDLLKALAIRGTASKRAIATYDFLEKTGNNHGIKVSQLNTSDFTNMTRLMRKMGMPKQQVDRAIEIDDRIREIIRTFGLSEKELALQAELGNFRDVEDMLLSSKPLTNREEVEAGARILRAQRNDMTDELKRLRAELDTLIPETGIYLPRGAFKKFKANTIPNDIIEEGILTPEEMENVLTVLNGQQVEEGSPFIMVPMSKLKQVMAISRNVPAWVMPKEIADSLNHGLSNFITMGPEANRIYRFFANQLNWWRKWTLTIFPIYHTRNAVSDTINMMHGGFDDVAALGEAWQFQSHRYLTEFDGITDTFGRKWNHEELLKDMSDLGVLGQGFYAAELGSVLKNELKKPVLSPIPFIGGDRNVLLRAGNFIGQNMENHRRIALYFDGLKKGMPPHAAAFRVKRYLFDYFDLTAAERWIRGVAVPFWTWTARNIPLQLQMMLTRPGRFLALEKGKRTAFNIYMPDGEEQQDMPEWMNDQLPVPVGRGPDGQVYMFLFGSWLPQADIWRLQDPGAMATGMLSPFIKAPVEWIMNKSLFFNSDVERSPRETQEFMGMRMRRREINALRNIRWANTMDRLIFDDRFDGKQKLANFLFSKVYPVDVTKQREFEAYKVEREIQAFDRSIRREMKGVLETQEKGRLGGVLPRETGESNLIQLIIQRDDLQRELDRLRQTQRKPEDQQTTPFGQTQRKPEDQQTTPFGGGQRAPQGAPSPFGQGGSRARVTRPFVGGRQRAVTDSLAREREDILNQITTGARPR